MINDFLAWRKVYKGPFSRHEAEILLGDLHVSPDETGIYAKRIRKANKTNKYFVFVKIEQKLSTSVLDRMATSRYNEDIINNNNKNEEKESNEEKSGQEIFTKKEEIDTSENHRVGDPSATTSQSSNGY